MADERGRVDMGNDEDVIIMLAEMISAEEEHGDGFGPDPTVIQQFLEEHDVGPERFKALAAEFVSYIEASEGWRWEEIVAVLDVFGFKTMIALQRRHVGRQCRAWIDDGPPRRYVFQTAWGGPKWT